MGPIASWRIRTRSGRGRACRADRVGPTRTCRAGSSLPTGQDCTCKKPGIWQSDSSGTGVRHEPSPSGTCLSRGGAVVDRYRMRLGRLCMHAREQPHIQALGELSSSKMAAFPSVHLCTYMHHSYRYPPFSFCFHAHVEPASQHVERVP